VKDKKKHIKKNQQRLWLTHMVLLCADSKQYSCCLLPIYDSGANGIL
jgi:hypothetical protein